MKKTFYENPDKIVYTYTLKERVKRLLKGEGFAKEEVNLSPSAIHMAEPLIMNHIERDLKNSKSYAFSKKTTNNQ